MRRRFGRGRKTKGAAESKRAPIDAARAFAQLVEAGVAGVAGLEAIVEDGIAPSFAVVGRGERDGKKVLVAFAPHNAGDAALAGVAVAQRLAAEEGFGGRLTIAAPQWSSGSRRRLAALALERLPFDVRAVAVSSLGEDGGAIEPEPAVACAGVSARQVAAALGRASDRELFLRAASALEGLAAKHGGATRGVGSRLELVLLASRTAALHAGVDSVDLEILGDERSKLRLSAAGLATAMDQLEGAIRKQLNDRRVRDGEEGLRATITGSLAEVAGVRDAQRWPIGGGDSEVVDLVGVHDDGVPVLGVVRNELTLATLAGLLDAAISAQPLFPSLLANAPPPLRFGPPRLLIAAKEFNGAALRVLSALTLDHVEFDLEIRRSGEPRLELREGAAAAVASRPAPVARASAPEAADGAVSEVAADADAAERSSEREGEPGARGRGRSRGRGRRGGRASRSGDEGDRDERERESVEAASSASSSDSAGPAGFDEMSLFDLGEDERGAAEGGEDGGKRSRRGRGRGRRRRGGRSAEGVDAEREDGGPEGGEADTGRAGTADLAEDGEAFGDDDRRESGSERGRGRRHRRGRSKADDDDGDDDDELSGSLVSLEDMPELAAIDVPAYEEDDEEDDDMVRRRREAEERALKAGIVQPAVEREEETLDMPRKRAAIVVHADRASLICGVLLARDLRQIEGIWVYGQDDLMTFFRSVATDLSDSTPIYVIGFSASPARETLQAAALYRGRLAWFDHRDWPPEDLGEMREVLGGGNVHVTPGAESCLSDVLALRTRRSRFSDKIVELATGRFSQHDYERWGRLWWHRLGEAAQRIGERRADLDALLNGRPSDLAKEAERIPTPVPPSEVRFISERDFRLVHFHGFTLVVVPVPPELDLHLTARIARERYEAEVSVARSEDGDLVVLGADESRSKRGINLSGMLDHLASKHDWVLPLAGEDHVARLRIRDLVTRPERFDELISEIAMGRSIFEG